MLLVVNSVNVAQSPARRQALCWPLTGEPGGDSVLKALSPVGSGRNISYVLNGSRWELRERALTGGKLHRTGDSGTGPWTFLSQE